MWRRFADQLDVQLSSADASPGVGVGDKGRAGTRAGTDCVVTFIVRASYPSDELHSRNITNVDDLAAIARSAHCTVYTLLLQDLSLHQQIIAMRRTTLLVGADGTGLLNRYEMKCGSDGCE